MRKKSAVSAVSAVFSLQGIEKTGLHYTRLFLQHPAIKTPNRELCGSDPNRIDIITYVYTHTHTYTHEHTHTYPDTAAHTPAAAILPYPDKAVLFLPRLYHPAWTVFAAGYYMRSAYTDNLSESFHMQAEERRACPIFLPAWLDPVRLFLVFRLRIHAAGDHSPSFQSLH